MVIDPQPALTLPADFEPLALGLPASPGSRSRYPAKKAKRTRPVAPAQPASAMAEPEPRVDVASPTAPVLLIGYHPTPPADEAEPAPTGDEAHARLNLDAWADDVLRALVARPAIQMPTPAMVRAAATPLPRHATVTLWRKNGPLDAIARWVRTHAWRLAVKIAPKSSLKTTEVARLRAENEALRRQLVALQQMPA